MIRIIFCMLGIFIFGVIYAEILNALIFHEFRINVYIFAGSISIVFMLMDIIFNHYEKKASISSQDGTRFEKLKLYYYVFFSIIGFILVVAVPFVWWGAIKSLAMMANGGGK